MAACGGVLLPARAHCGHSVGESSARVFSANQQPIGDVQKMIVYKGKIIVGTVWLGLLSHGLTSMLVITVQWSLVSRLDVPPTFNYFNKRQPTGTR